jgi:hypothetical protein
VPRIVIEVPEEFKRLGESIQRLVDEAGRTRLSFAGCGRAFDYSEVEKRMGVLAAGSGGDSQSVENRAEPVDRRWAAHATLRASPR